MEILKPDVKLELGGLALDLLAREKASAIRDALLFAIARLGARVPVYGPLNAILPAEAAERWARRLVELNPVDEKASFAVVQLCRRTDDRYRDVADDVRERVLTWLESRQAAPHLTALVREGGHLAADEQRTVFGEALPRGLRIE
jgi:hypothetical protein